jgi:putative DNA primase/helicase
MKYQDGNMLGFSKEISVGDCVISEEGVIYRDVRDDRDQMIPVCSRLVVKAITRNNDGNDWGKVLIVCDPEGNEKQYHMSSSKNHNVVISDLIHRGLVLSPHGRARNLLAQYLRSAPSRNMMLSSSMPGWVKNSFVLSYGSFGAEEVVFSGDSNIGFGYQGNWKAKVGKLCSGNSRLLFAASVAFAAPLMRIVGVEGGGSISRAAQAKGRRRLCKLPRLCVARLRVALAKTLIS